VTPAVYVRPAGRVLVVLLVASALVAACGGTASSPPSASPTPAPGSASPAPTDAATPAPTDDATPSAELTPSEEPTEEPTDEPTASPGATPSPGATASPGSAAACAGNDNNRAWFESLARAVDWDVYCPVLPAGWFVVTGNYSLRGGGKMDITYRGPSGQRLEILEGAYCAGVTGCPPAGPDGEAASFGNRPAQLLGAAGGGWVVVATGGDVNWQATGIGMDGPTLAAHTAAFVLVDG
jgi:hypothetical protein